MKNENKFRKIAFELFEEALKAVDAENSVEEVVSLNDSVLTICNETYFLPRFNGIYVIAFGKAANKMALGMQNKIGQKITKGIISSPKSDMLFPQNWKVFHGGHPVPNQDSLQAAEEATKLLRNINNPQSLVIFLVSGGGSAMLELPKDDQISLNDLIKFNQVLVNCGATIKEINTLRKSISQIKGGGLSKLAPLTQQISLIISDTNAGDEKSVASGPTIWDDSDLTESTKNITSKYNLESLIPGKIIRFLKASEKEEKINNKFRQFPFYNLADNRIALESIEINANKSGFITEIAGDLVENEITEGCVELVERCLSLVKKNKGQKVALISGGEFRCPVKGKGVGGRNQETVLRCLLEIQKRAKDKFYFTILSAGTDGIDGNSRAAGATGDQTSLSRAKKLGLDPKFYLENSDSNNFFKGLQDTVEIGATGTNVRDVRILLAEPV